MNQILPEGDLQIIQNINELRNLKCVVEYDETTQTLTLVDGLTLFPKEIIKYAELIRTLHIPNYKNGFLPPEFARLGKLEELYMLNSGIITLPQILGRTGLKIISVTHQEAGSGKLRKFIIKSIPDTIENLILDNNPDLAELPFGFHNKEKLSKISAIGTSIDISKIQHRVKNKIEILLDA